MHILPHYPTTIGYSDDENQLCLALPSIILLLVIQETVVSVAERVAQVNVP